MGQISGWISGEFDFEVIRVSDGKDIFWRHADMPAVNELEEACANFLRNMQNPELSGDGGRVEHP